MLWIIYLAVIVFLIAANWKIFTKAGEAGWKSIIPIWNLIVLLRIVGRPLWWLILFIIPIVGLVVAIILIFNLAKSFGRGVGFGFGMLFLPFIFYPILGFGSSTYRARRPELGPRDRVEHVPFLWPVGQVRMVEVTGRIVRHADPFHDSS